MAKIDANLEEERTEIVFRAVQNNPGLKQSELEDHTGLKGRTLNNYLNKLEYAGKLKREKQRWHISDVFVERKLRPIELTAEQAMSLYIAARALARVQDERNETAESALIALSKAMVGDFNIGDDMHKAVLDLARRPERTGYNKVYRELMRACVYRKKVKIVYETAKGYEFETEFEPYLFEPSLFGFSIYAIGFSSIVAGYRSYKLERIKSAEMLRAAYDPHENIPTLHSLKSAWSIMFGDETETVELEFAPSVRKRVLETNWHISQKTDSDDPTINAPLNWKVDVADARDLLPWVRGWGADVTIKQPEWLRNSVIEHVRALNLNYDIFSTPNTSDADNTASAHRWLWAKADSSGNLHRLTYHMIDVGQCAGALWQRVLNPQLKQRIASWLGTNVEDAGRLVAFWASLHDLGKSSPAFQDHPSLRRKNKLLHQRIQYELKQAGLIFPLRGDETHARHEVISTWSLHSNGENLLTKLSHLPSTLSGLIAHMLGGHHGAFPTSILLSPTQLQQSDKQNGKDDLNWARAREQLFMEMQRTFHPPTAPQFEESPERDNPILVLLAGIVSAADWLGSDESAFPLTEEIVPIKAYARQSAKLAELALIKANWEPVPDTPEFNFRHVFGFTHSPAQQQASDSLKDAALPVLVIAEMPMGSGKTEIAQEAVAHWLHKGGLNGAYIAMPTTATSNQMHQRTTRFLQKFVGGNIEPMLVHSQALLRNVPQSEGEQSDEQVEEAQHDGDRAAAQAWFLPRKKSLLAPFGVGTVDQALMSVLQTKHFFVRLLGLSHKVVVFDEVHAYDAYMSVLFDRLLIWLGQLGTSVIILSATLPQATRQKFIKAYAGNKIIPTATYPRLTVAPLTGEVSAIDLTPPPTKTLAYAWMRRDVAAIVEYLRTQLKDGGCAAVICNTVARAQQVYQAIQDAGLIDLNREDEACTLFHARYPMAWRETIENKVLDKFGPNKADKGKRNGLRPAKAIVVATQVIEQSLDLDFDVMISDHAPVDLLLQRAGRLHRHSANEAVRKHDYRLMITAPEVADGIPQFDHADKLVYDEYVLLCSWLALQQRAMSEIKIPDELSELIEQVYGEQNLVDVSQGITAKLVDAKQTMDKKIVKAEDKAEENLIREPSYRNFIFKQQNRELEDDDANLNLAFRAATRLGDPGIRAVCLERIDEALYVVAHEEQWKYQSNKAPQQDTVIKLARSVVNINHPDYDMQSALLHPAANSERAKIMATWKKISALRYYAVMIFENGKFRLEGTDYTVQLDKELGLKIQKEAQ